MSSPLANLKRGKKAPLQPGASPRGRVPPFRHGINKEDVLLGGSHSDNIKHKQQSSRNGDKAPNDKELLSVVMMRLTNAERELRDANITIKEKDKRIRVLEEKCALLRKAKGHEDGRVAELESMCQSLQEQVLEMENFLEDYGMIWVGNSTVKKTTDVTATPTDSIETDDSQDTIKSDDVWQPVSSLPPDFQLDFDQVIKNVNELNVLAGEGEHVVRHTMDGARLQVKESVPITLYANGIVLFSGPFRPYSDSETQQCMQDLMDGYFPGELQDRYPDGVPLQLSDKRGVYFRDFRQERLFPGSGHVLTESKQQDKNKDTKEEETDNRLIKNSDKLPETSDIPGRPKQSLDQFLKKLPSTIVQKGRMVEVRSNIEDMLKDSVEKSEVHIIETETAKELRSRPESGGERKPASITTLRIKSENGEKTFLLKMKAEETIADLRRYIDTQRPPDAPVYSIRTTFPNKTYDNDSMSLKECGLVPNATLHLTCKR